MQFTYLVSILLVGLLLSNVFPTDSFVETFDGNGSFDDTTGTFSGLDNPDWSLVGNGEIRDGGYAFHNDTKVDGDSADRVLRGLFTNCGYVERIEIRDLYMGPVFNQVGLIYAASTIVLEHFAPGIGGLSILISEDDENVSDWGIGFHVLNQEVGTGSVPAGSSIALEIRYDEQLSQATFAYDNDTRDHQPPRTFGPFPHVSAGETQITGLSFIANRRAEISGILDYWSLDYACEGGSGDFNGNGVLDIEDIDLLSNVVRLGTNDPTYDLTSDQVVDGFDRTVWVESLRKTYFGDSNLDGEFGSADLVAVFQAGQYEDATDGNSGWATGDWNGDTEFTSRDLVLAFTGGGYETGPRASVHSVPEPALVALYSIAGLIWLVGRNRRRRGWI